MEKPQVFDIQPDGPGLWRIVVPEHNLEWTESDFPQDPKQGFVSDIGPATETLIKRKCIKQIQLSGSEGSTKQKFTFQRFIGP